MSEKKPIDKKRKNPDNPDRQLTVKQEAFCILVASGKTGIDSYKEAFETEGWNTQSLRTNASKLRAKDPIRARIREIIMDRFTGVMLTQEERIKVLNQTALFGDNAASLKAIDILNRMDGSYTEKIDITSQAEVRVYLPQKRTPVVSK